MLSKLSAIMLNAIMLSVIMLSVIMLSGLAYFCIVPSCNYGWLHWKGKQSKCLWTKKVKQGRRILQCLKTLLPMQTFK